MIPLLLLAFALGGQAEPPAEPGPPARFIICPGHERCPPRARRPETVGFGVIAGAVIGGGIGSARTGDGRLDFAAGEAALTPVSRERIDAIGRQMIANPRLDAFVEGHADLRGTGAASIALAGRRAAAAAAYLIERGVAADRVTAISWGNVGAETHADDRDAGARNRSVVIGLRRRPGPRL